MAALATEGVHAMGRGRFVEAATYEGAEKVSGVVGFGDFRDEFFLSPFVCNKKE